MLKTFNTSNFLNAYLSSDDVQHSTHSKESRPETEPLGAN